ncbi:MAG: DUF6361 family protein, partial [Dehalococcoidia bacterium]
HAQRFSLAMHGAQLLYNLMVSQGIRRLRSDDGRVEVGEDLVPEYQSRLDEWVNRVKSSDGLLAEWDVAAMWRLVTEANPRLPSATRTFVGTWIKAVREHGPRTVVGDDGIGRMIRARELQMKGRLARLWDERRLERYGGAAGAEQLTFRWGSVRAVVADISAGLRGSRAGA